MKRPLATLAACAALLVCSACSQNEPPMPPETERVYASVLAECGGDEYTFRRLDRRDEQFMLGE